MTRQEEWEMYQKELREELDQYDSCEHDEGACPECDGNGYVNEHGVRHTCDRCEGYGTRQ
jgi:RecJ-like exonuclease